MEMGQMKEGYREEEMKWRTQLKGVRRAEQ
jgi:hypothetical protein